MKVIIIVLVTLAMVSRVNSDLVELSINKFRCAYKDLKLSPNKKQWGPSLSKIVDLTFDYVKLFSWRTFVNYAIIDAMADAQFYNITFEQMGIFQKYQDPDLTQEL